MATTGMKEADDTKESDMIPDEEVPEEFKCPISKKLMRDPVILPSGLTYDRPFIEEWLKHENPLIRDWVERERVAFTPNHWLIRDWDECERVAVTPLIPNLVIRDMISRWCRNRAITISDNNEGVGEDVMPKPKPKPKPKPNNVISSLNDSTKAEDSVEDLVCALREAKDEEVRKKIIGRIQKICVDDKISKCFGEAIDAIVDATRRGSGSRELRTLNILATLDSNKLLIVKCGVFWHLVDLLKSGKEPEATEAAQLIQKLCTIPSNKVRAVDEAFQVLMGTIDSYVFKDTCPVVVDIILDVLKLLVHETSARYKMEELDAVHWLFHTIDNTANPLTKEHCVAILYTALFADKYVSSWGVAMYNEETKYRTLARLMEQGTPAAQSMASILLNKLNRNYPNVRVYDKHLCYYADMP